MIYPSRAQTITYPPPFLLWNEYSPKGGTVTFHRVETLRSTGRKEDIPSKKGIILARQKGLSQELSRRP